jgi:hypothetical protein
VDFACLLADLQPDAIAGHALRDGSEIAYTKNAPKNTNIVCLGHSYAQKWEAVRGPPSPAVKLCPPS